MNSYLELILSSYEGHMKRASAALDRMNAATPFSAECRAAYAEYCKAAFAREAAWCLYLQAESLYAAERTARAREATT